MGSPRDRLDRLDWVDVGRGIAIVLVVLYHAARWFESDQWQSINSFVASLRMPFFFAMSGILAARAVRGPWRDIWVKRLSLYLWVFGVFEVIGTVCYLVGFAIRGPRHGTLGLMLGMVEAPYRPLYELWFIWALALFVVLARLTRNVPTWIQLSVAVVPSVIALTDGFDLGNLGWNGALKYYFFFLLGVHLRTVLLRWSTSSPWLRATSFAVWLAVATGVTVSGIGDVPGVVLVLSCLGVLAGVSLATSLVWLSPLRRTGTDTLPIYVGHTPIIILSSALLIRVVGLDTVQAAGLVLVPLAALGALLLAQLVPRAFGGRFGFLYRAPLWLQHPGALRPDGAGARAARRASLVRR